MTWPSESEPLRRISPNAMAGRARPGAGTLSLRRTRSGGRRFHVGTAGPVSPPRSGRSLGQRTRTFTTSLGTRDYGNTKRGEYMCEADAQAAGNRAAKNERHP